MKLNKILAAVALGLAIAVAASCTNRAQVSISSYPLAESETLGTVTCYSGGVKIFEDTAAGRINTVEGVFRFVSKTTGKHVRISADCILVK